MAHLVLIFVVILAVLLSFIFFKKIHWPALLIAIVAGAACNFAVAEWLKDNRCEDIEYIGNIVLRVEYYEPWDEWVEETCTDENGDEYDCSHSTYHDARWEMVDYGDHHYTMKESEYDDIIRYINGQPVYVDLKRNYYRIDGDMYRADIPEERLIIPVTRERKYKNKIRLNESLYHYEIISDGERDSLGLYDYPEVGHYSPHPYPNPYPKSVRAYQPATLGLDADHPFTTQMNIINGKCVDRLRTFVFFFYDKDREVVKKQLDRLQLGNFNELLVFLGVHDDRIMWCETHSWEDVPTMSTAVKQWFVVNNRMDSLLSFVPWYVDQILAGKWTLKDAHDFDYIRVNLSLSQVLWLCVVQIIFQILVFLYLSVFIRRRRRIQKKYSTNNLPPDDWQRHVKTVIHMNTMFLAMAVIFVLISGRHWLSVGSWHFSFWYIILRLPSLCVLLALPIFMQNIIILKGLMKVKQAGGA